MVKGKIPKWEEFMDDIDKYMKGFKRDALVYDGKIIKRITLSTRGEQAKWFIRTRNLTLICWLNND